MNIWQSDWQENWLPYAPCAPGQLTRWKMHSPKIWHMEGTNCCNSITLSQQAAMTCVCDWQASSCYNYYPIDHFLLAERRHLLLTGRRSHAFSRQVSSWFLRVLTVGHSVAFFNVATVNIFPLLDQTTLTSLNEYFYLRQGSRICNRRCFFKLCLFVCLSVRNCAHKLLNGSACNFQGRLPSW